MIFLVLHFWIEKYLTSNNQKQSCTAFQEIRNQISIAFFKYFLEWQLVSYFAQKKVCSEYVELKSTTHFLTLMAQF